MKKDKSGQSTREKILGANLESNRKSYHNQLKKELETAKENERRLQVLIDNIPALISFINKDKHYVLVNRTYEKTFGLKKDEVVGQHVKELLGQENYNMVESHINKALSGHYAYYENSFMGLNGGIQWLDVTYVPNFDMAGEVNGFYVLGVDITEKKQTEETLQYNDLLLREIGSIAKIGGWEFDPATGKGTWTDEVARIYDLDPVEEATVEKGMSYFHGESRKKIQAAVQSAIESGQPFDLELELTSAKGIHKWVRTIGHAKMKNGRVAQVRGSLQDTTDSKIGEQKRIASEERFRVLVESAPDAIFVQTRGRFAYLNSSAVKLFGANSVSDLFDTPVMDRIHPDFHDVIKDRIRLMNQEKIPAPDRHEIFLKLDGSSVDVEASVIPMNYEGIDGALVFVRDISDRIKAETEQQSLQAQLNQIQRMESVGRLAGGIAHDYNNFLSVIIGYTELSLSELKPDDELHNNLMEVLNAAQRTRAVTHQLLAFARKEAIAPEVLDLNTTVESMLKMIRRLIGENIELLWKPGTGLWPVEMDPSQIDQILANLCINARDAIKDIGAINIETGKVNLNEDDCKMHLNGIPGDFVTLTISDNGCGMDKETVEQIFEPFFTTKDIGKGTGLGLSTIYGIVKQNKGFINVYSEPDNGTAFKIFLPRYDGHIEDECKHGTEEIPKGYGETILIVEDEVSILKLTESLLKRYGYHVLTVENPLDAISIAKNCDRKISLLITDVIMPEMNGRVLVERIKSIMPDIRYLFMSGYTADVIAHSGILEKGLHFIQKPFSSKDLAIKIRQVLNRVA